MSPFLRPAVPAAPLPYRDDSPEGLAARWVRWVAGAGLSNDPVDDRSGELAGDRQPSDVRFLAGSYGARVVRRCPAPAGVPLFLPVVNRWSTEGPLPVLPRAEGTATLDGVPLDVTEIATPVPFEVSGPRFNPVTGRRAAVPVRVWGLWSRAAGLAPGAHVVTVSGGDGDGFTLDVRYELDVA